MQIQKQVTNTISLQSFTPATAPVTGSAAGGTLAATTYYVKLSAVTAAGESTLSPETTQAVAVNSLLTVTIPAPSGSILGYNVYVSTASGNETKQNAAVITAGGTWTEPVGGLIAGTAAPAVDNSGLQTVTVYTVPASPSAAVSPIYVITDIELLTSSASAIVVSLLVGGVTVQSEFVSASNPVRLHGLVSPITALSGQTVQVSVPSGPSATQVIANLSGNPGVFQA